MAYFLQQLINGLTLGSIYGLIAIGYTMVYGIIGMINFAHGEIYMIGAFCSVTVFLLLGLAGISYVPLALAVMLIVVDAVHLALWLGGRAHRLPAAARLFPVGAADLGDRHVDLSAELRAGDARRPAEADPAAGAGRLHDSSSPPASRCS